MTCPSVARQNVQGFTLSVSGNVMVPCMVYTGTDIYHKNQLHVNTSYMDPRGCSLFGLVYIYAYVCL